MTVKLLSTILTVAALTGPLGIRAEPFEGTFTMKTKTSSGQVLSTTYSVKGARTRTEQSNGTAIITDAERGEITMLMPAKRMYMVRKLNAPVKSTANSKPTVTLRKTLETETILGYPCTKYVSTVETRGMTINVELWVTDRLGTFVEIGASSGSGAQSPWSDALSEAQGQMMDIFPLRITTTSDNAKANLQIEVTSVEKKSLGDSLFEAPADWRHLDMRSMANPSAR